MLICAAVRERDTRVSVFYSDEERAVCRGLRLVANTYTSRPSPGMVILLDGTA